MSMNFQLGFLPYTKMAEVGELTGPEVEFDHASSRSSLHISVAQIGLHTVAVSPMLDLEDLPVFQQPRHGTGIVTLAGFADIYHLIYYGDETRVRVEAEGEVVEDIGTPLSAERFFDDEKYPEDATPTMLRGCLARAVDSA